MGISSDRFVARIDPGYLWGRSDEEALPSSVGLSVWDPSVGLIFGPPGLPVQVTDATWRQMETSPRGTFVWHAAKDAFVATWWSLPEAHRFRFPTWRVLLSEPQAEVLAPMAGFSRSFPLLLAFSLGVVLILGLSQIRRSLVPLAELSRELVGSQRATSRTRCRYRAVTSWKSWPARSIR